MPPRKGHGCSQGGQPAGWDSLAAMGIVAGVSMLVSLVLILFFAPLEKEMGIVQKIFYVHVASAFAAFTAFGLTFICSIAYLVRRSRAYDQVAASSVEVGLVFCTIVLLTGPIWAKAAWGVWWTWDPRLTTTLVLWLIYVGYLLLRASAMRERRRAVAAVYGIIGFIDVPIVFMSIRWWRTIHPVVIELGGIGLSPRMKLVFFITLLAFFLWYLYLLMIRWRVAALEEEIDDLRKRRISEGSIP